MSTLTMIRHGESHGNINEKTESTATNPLTPRGKTQAIKVADKIYKIFPPGIIIYSPYLRTEQTAAPFKERYLKTITEKWPIQEFTYLSATKYANTNMSERQPARNAYWDKLDPDYVDGDGAESYNQMILRAERFIRKFLQNGYTSAVAFTHGQFMKAVLLLLQTEGFHDRRPTMKEFYYYHLALNIPNTGIVNINFTQQSKPNISFS